MSGDPFSQEFNAAFGQGLLVTPNSPPDPAPDSPPDPSPAIVILVGQNAVIGSGLHILQLFMAEDYYSGHAQMTVAVNGVQAWTKPVSVTASWGSNQEQAFTIIGAWRNAPKVVISFVNDAYAGVGMDRNLYLRRATYDNIPVAVFHKFETAGSFQFTA